MNIRVKTKPSASMLSIGSCVAVSIAWLAYGAVVKKMCSSAAEAGQFGDMFGGFDALITGFGFAGIATTL